MLQKSTQSTDLKLGFKENIFLIGLLGWSSLGMVVASVAGFSGKKQSGSTLVFAVSFISLVIGGIYLGLDFNSPISRFLICLAIVTMVVAWDCERRKFLDNITIHLVNSGYVGVAAYFLLMELFPNNFEVGILWKEVIPSAPTAFNMLILCVLCLNVGYYLVFPILSSFLVLRQSWFLSARNAINLGFIRKPTDEIFLFLSLAGLGLITRIWNFTLGRFFYISGGSTESESIPALVSSFFAQFDSLYTVAWLYGASLLFQDKLSKNKGQKLIGTLSIFLIGLELIYQIVSGSKGRFAVFVIIPLGLCYFFTSRRVTWSLISVFVTIGGLSLFIIYPLLVLYRAEITSTKAAFDITVLLAKSWENLRSLSWEEYQKIFLTPFNSSGNAEQVIAMTSIVHNIERLPIPPEYLWERLLWFWLPRFLSPGKLTSIPSNAIGRLTGRVGDNDFTTSVLQTGPGELFIYYQLFGCLMMILPGILFRWINEAASPFRLYSAFRTSVYITYLPLMFGVLGGGFEAGVTGMILQLGVLYITLELLRAAT